MDASPTAPETMEFRTEIRQLLDIIIHSLYSDREIFLRELISNASDAIDKLRFEALTQPELLDGDEEWKIEIAPNHLAGTLTISDNGIGMDSSSIVENLGTIARSGTQAFLENLKQADATERPALIGQFGVGFYSAFMVAKKVTVRSRAAGSSEGVEWESEGEGQFSIQPCEKATRGTEIILDFRDDAKDFAEEHRIRHIVQKYSDFIEHPIVMEVDKEVGEGDDQRTERVTETLNSRKALWLRSPSEVTEEEYGEFYRKITHDFTEPFKRIHFAAEGTLEFRALLFLPKHKPFDFQFHEPKSGLNLYIQRVFIMDDCRELLPGYLRFVRGVVDSSDLPLNVSREMLQENPTLAKIRKGLVNKVLRFLDEMREKEYDDYVAFYREFGDVLKEGVGQDFSNRDKLSELLLFESTETKEDELASLRQYVDRMRDGQESIFYLIGETRSQIENSPYVEGARARGEEVLLLTDPIDEFLVSSLTEFQGKTLQAVDRTPSEPEQSDELRSLSEKLSGLLGALQEKLPEVGDVRLTDRLHDSASCLVAGAGSMGAHMERLMKRMGRGDELPESKRILELNANHPTVQALQRIHAADPSDERVEDIGQLLYDQAVIAEGSTVKDPMAMARRINRLIEKAAGGDGA